MDLSSLRPHMDRADFKMAVRIVGTMAGVLLGLAALRIADPPPPWVIVATISIGVLLGSVFRRRGTRYNPLVAIVAGLFLWPTDLIEGLTALIRDQGEGTPDVLGVLARADQGSRFNPLRRTERSQLPDLAVPARTLSAIRAHSTEGYGR